MIQNYVKEVVKMKRIAIVCLAAWTCLAFASCRKKPDVSAAVMSCYNAANKLIEDGDYDAARRLIDDAVAVYGEGELLHSLIRKMEPTTEAPSEAETTEEASETTAKWEAAPVEDDIPDEDDLDDLSDLPDTTAVKTTKKSTARTTTRSYYYSSYTTAAPETEPSATTVTEAETTAPAIQTTTQPVTLTAPTLVQTSVREKAAALAKEQLEQAACSRSRLIGELQAHGFSESEAVYAADHCGADWKAQAVLFAKAALQDDPDITDEALLERLTDAGFTDDETQYALGHCR